MERLVSLITGGGTTMEQMALAIQRGDVPGMTMAGMIASKPDAGGIEKARRLNIPVDIVDPRYFRTPEGKHDSKAFGARLIDVLENRFGATVITQNGWIPHTPGAVTNRYGDRLFNQHPGPPENFGGKGMMGKAVHAAVLRFQELVGRTFDTSVVAHYADPVVDMGSVVVRRKVEVLHRDTVDSLQQRALPEEHLAQIELLRQIVAGKLRVLDAELLVHADEMHLLEEAKDYAVGAYPKG